jgi:hypothetical protein
MGFWKSVNKFGHRTFGKKNFSMMKRIGMKSLASAIGHGVDEIYGGGNDSSYGKQEPDNYTKQEPGQSNIFETKRPHNQMSKKKIISLERRAKAKASKQAGAEPGQQSNQHASAMQRDVFQPYYVPKAVSSGNRVERPSAIGNNY